ncbi:hypothetical protein BH09PSE4_BH09PSE4_09390 [soil metagenome]
MPHPSIPVAMLLVLAAPAAEEGDGQQRMSIGQITIHERIIVRVPTIPVGRQPMSGNPLPPSPATYAEKKGPKCVAVKALAGAAITRTDSVDFVLTGGKRMRAKLGDDCPALDFYSGFYLKPSADGMICADRDSVRSRSGDQCPIDAFKTLVPKR